jgi:hypothetical protein
MENTNKKKYEEKLKRINDAIALKEPDRVPVTPPPELFPVFNAGYTVAEVVYDSSLQKIKNATLKYLKDFDPDNGSAVGFILAGEGAAMELCKAKNMCWAGMPGDVIDKNSLHQFIEYPVLLDDEFDEMRKDRTGWALRKALPRLSGLTEPLSALRAAASYSNFSVRQLAGQLSTPDARSMIQDLWALDDYYQTYQTRVADIEKEIETLGYPVTGGGMAAVPFDDYSDYLRGTILSLSDIYDRPEAIERYIEESLEETLAAIKATKGQNEGKHVFMPLHKGMDGFMSGDDYRKYYWSHLQKIILAIIDSGKVPYIYTEGKYNSRIDCLTEVPPGKVFYHFEDVDMAAAKKKLAGIACISGGFQASLLDWGTPQQVRDEVKRLMDTCAPGGGFIFETSCGLGNCKRENVEAMFEAAREYGIY